MASAETAIVNDIMKALSRQGVTLFRNVRGMFLTPDGKRKVAAGLLAPGASDLIGGTRVKITPEMVGRTVLILTALEIKTPTGNASPAQRDFVAFIEENGGFAGIARNPQEAEKICRLGVDSSAGTAL